MGGGGGAPKGEGGGGGQKKKKNGSGGGGGAGPPKKKKNYYFVFLVFFFFWGGPPPPLPFSERDSHVLAPGVILLNVERFIDSRYQTQDVWILCTSTRCTLLLFNIEESIV